MKDYKKILEGVVNIINTAEKSDIGFTNICTYIGENCPELKEREDESIRKSPITFFQRFPYGSLESAGTNPKEAIAWLEKQGGITKLSEEEQNRFAKGVLSSCAMSFINYLDAHKYEGKMCVSNSECEDIENAFQNAMWDRLHRYYCKYIEKQGEYKSPEEVLKIRQELYQSGYNDGYKHGCEDSKKKDEQKSADISIKEKAHQIAWEMSKHYDPLLPKESWCEMAALDMASWLNKQGEPNPYSGVSFKYNNHTWGMCARDGGVEVGIDGQLKAFVSLDKSFVYPTNPIPDIKPKSALEANGEEKVDSQNCAADNVKSKFKAGDWIINSKGTVAHINNVKEDIYGILRYYIEFSNGIKSDPMSFFVDLEYHLWTIADAKAGDVLVDVYGNIGIFEKYDDDYCWVSYCFIWEDGIFALFKGTHANEKTYPATKEQRDTLEKAMADAGYEWIEETKELKKIESNSAWSEVDNVYVYRIKNLLTDISLAPESRNSLFDWLKSLKDRVGCEANFTTTWKPSDEQIKAFEHFVKSIGESGYASPYENNTKLLSSLLEQLKKIKVMKLNNG